MAKYLSMLLFVGCLCAAWTVSAHSYRQGDIEIGHVWARATPAGMTIAAIYGPFLNTGKEPDRLIGASSPLASKIEIHENMNDNGIMKMPKLDALTLNPNEPVALKPGGIHLMVMGLKRPLKEGEMFPVELQFEKAGTAKVDVMVEAVGAMAGSH